MESPGVFALKLDDVEVARDSDFGSYEVTNCGGVTLSPIVCPTLLPSTSPTVTLLPTLIPSISPTVTQSPSSSPSKHCADGCDLVRIEITLGEQSSNSYWDLRDQGSDKIFLEPIYDLEEQTIVREFCKPVTDCYLFRHVNTKDAIASVFLNGREIAKSTTEEGTKIGDSCSML